MSILYSKNNTKTDTQDAFSFVLFCYFKEMHLTAETDFIEIESQYHLFFFLRTFAFMHLHQLHRIALVPTLLRLRLNNNNDKDFTLTLPPTP